MRKPCSEGRSDQTLMSQGYVLSSEFRCTFAKFETLFFYMQRVTKEEYYDDLNRLTKETRLDKRSNTVCFEIMVSKIDS